MSLPLRDEKKFFKKSEDQFLRSLKEELYQTLALTFHTTPLKTCEVNNTLAIFLTMCSKTMKKRPKTQIDPPAQADLPKGEIARQALASRLRRGGKLMVMRRYFGAMHGPLDLSTNKAYRRQWNKKQA